MKFNSEYFISSMILKFNQFITERLSYSEDVEIISKIIIEYLYGKENWKSEEVIKIDNPVINEVNVYTTTFDYKQHYNRLSFDGVPALTLSKGVPQVFDD